MANEVYGLGHVPQSEWPKAPTVGTPVKEILRPGSDSHKRVLEHLTTRIDFSERKMKQFYPRWQTLEAKVQAYIQLPDYEQILKNMNDAKKPPQVVSVVVPYSFATIATIVTYLLHTFCGRKPILQVSSYRGSKSQAARNMEMMLGYQADHSRLIKHLFVYLQNSQLYGLGVLRTEWTNVRAPRTKRVAIPTYSFEGQVTGQVNRPSRNMVTVYSGNTVEAIDPFMFFPDPRVPMTEVSQKGEFVFWRTYTGKHSLKRMEAQNTLFYVDHVGQSLPVNEESASPDSSRAALSGGDAFPGMTTDAGRTQNFVQVDEGTIDIIPAELGLSPSTNIERWLFTIGNRAQIIRAQPFDNDHGKHPVCVTEPYALGHGFGNPGISDYLGPLQDTVSWLVNSHMANVRTAINNMFVVDPSMIEMQDLKNPGDGKIIRLKRAAYGQDVRAAVSQLAVTDVTRGHMTDLQAFIRIGQQLSAVTDNVMGLQDSGGRKTATEIRTSGEAAASRLAAQARLISAQGMVDLAEQWVLNTQQYLTDEIELAVLGEEAQGNSVKLGPNEMAGDFYFPVHDGTLPFDKVALMDIWKEIFLGISKDPQLRAGFDIPRMFEFIAKLGGAQNIESFRLQMGDPAAVQQGAAAGNLVPIGGGGLPGTPPMNMMPT